MRQYVPNRTDTGKANTDILLECRKRKNAKRDFLKKMFKKIICAGLVAAVLMSVLSFGSIYAIAADSGTGGYEHYYYKIVGIKVKNFLHKVSEKESGWDINGDGKIKGTMYSKYISPTDWETKSISGKKFQSMLKKKVGSTKLKNMKYYKNISDERERILK